MLQAVLEFVHPLLALATLDVVVVLPLAVGGGPLRHPRADW
jgi:hypothetical protein